MTDFDRLRKALCRQRQNLSLTARTRASNAIVARVQSLPAYRDARHIATYIAFRGEVDTRALWHNDNPGKNWYLPVVHAGAPRPLQFARLGADTPLVKNQFGIEEPDMTQTTTRQARNLDLVLTPLVAFDSAVNRIGMGAGYYDRTFAFLRELPAPQKPLLIGMGYEFQHVDPFQPQPWDVPLAAVVTEKATYCR